MLKFFEKLDAKITRVVLFFIFLISVVSEFFGNLINLPENWEIPVIFLSLFLVVNMLTHLFEVEKNTKKIIEGLEIDNLTKYDNIELYYNDLSNAMKLATHSINSTHIRSEAPKQFVTSEKYFDNTENWCKLNKSAYFRRITTISNEKMAEWVSELKKIEDRTPNYHTKVCTWSSEFPMINFSVIDEERVFIALTGDITEKTCGYQIKDKKVCQYYMHYFNNAWAKSSAIQDLVS